MTSVPRQSAPRSHETTDGARLFRKQIKSAIAPCGDKGIYYDAFGFPTNPFNKSGGQRI